MKLKYKTGKSNIVTNALSQNVGAKSFVNSMVRIEGAMLDRIKAKIAQDQVTVKLLKQVADGITRKFWVEEGVLYAKGCHPYVPLTGGLQKELLRDTHDSPWAGHQGQEQKLSFLSQSYCWPRMENSVWLA